VLSTLTCLRRHYIQTRSSAMRDKSLNTPASAPQSWSTDCVCPRDREAYWIEAISAAFLAMESRPRDRNDFHGRVIRREIGELALMQVDSRAQDVSRLERHIGRDAPASFYLITQLDRPWAIDQAGHYVELAAGDLVLVDAAQPYRFHCPGEVHNLSLEMPSAWLARWLTDPGSHIGRRMPGTTGQGSALRGLLQVLAARPQGATTNAEQVIGTVLQWCLGEIDADTRLRDHRWTRLDALLLQRMAEPGLQASDLARELGCSVATLHRLFSAHGATFALHLRQLRLSEAARMLSSPALLKLSVAEIGRRCGFRDASHFGRVFAQHRGCTPGDWRRSNT
jgi:AraC family transcriptional regulator, positive regulator of tynA and feaB